MYLGSMRRKNNTEIPAAILQPPFYHLNYPDYINFSGRGTLIVHELMVSWWSDASTTAFYERVKCFVDQYDNYTVKGPNNTDLHIDGFQTFNENLADNRDVKLAFQAWRSRYRSEHVDTTIDILPGFKNYTFEQMYFLSYAQTRCRKQDADFLAWQTISDTHSPNKWLVNGALRNSAEFATAFKCGLALS
ncbi:hypothetical protein EC968_001904 [Mortierella alpina]|nr:hypothetical protein EC968_001904 [Mortierella alpina]